MEILPVSLVENFHFLRPLWLFGLIPAFLFFIALWRISSVATSWDKAIDKSLLPYLLDRSKNASQRTPLILLLSAWVLSILALAGPVWEQLPQPVQKKEDALVIVLDLSLSMFTPDHAPNRLDLAKRKLHDILDLRQEGQTALVVYAGDAHTVTPLTDDVTTIKALVPSLSPNIMPLFGSNPSTAMDLAIGLLNDANAKRGKILLMTDGISGLDEELLITEQFADNDYQLLIMGIGTEEGAPIPTNDGNFLTDNNGVLIVPTLNKDILQSLANRSNGRYHDIQLADSDLAYLLSDFEILDDEQLSSVEEEFDIWHESGPWLLLLILPIAALSFRRGWLFSFTLIVSSGLLFQSQQAQALEWKDLWKTKNQQAAEAYTSEEHAAAAALFESKDWQGAANYRAENYEAAVAAFNTIDSADGHYNRGNALALLGNYQEAIAAYDVTLELDGSHADALKNKNIVEELLKQEESESGENQDSEGQEGQSEQDSESGEEQESESGEEQDQEDSQDSQQEQQQQNQTQEEQEDSESNSEQDTPKETTNEEFEEQQSLEQWLRRIEDDPGELLRRKFHYQYRQRQLNGTTNNLQSGEQIW